MCPQENLISRQNWGPLLSTMFLYRRQFYPLETSPTMSPDILFMSQLGRLLPLTGCGGDKLGLCWACSELQGSLSPHSTQTEQKVKSSWQIELRGERQPPRTRRTSVAVGLWHTSPPTGFLEKVESNWWESAWRRRRAQTGGITAWAKSVAWLGECSLSMHKALSSVPSTVYTNTVMQACNPST